MENTWTAETFTANFIVEIFEEKGTPVAGFLVHLGSAVGSI
jgi:hypothetical protein